MMTLERFPDLQFFIIEHVGKVNKQLLNVELYGGRLLMIQFTINPFSKQAFLLVKMQVRHMPKKILYGRLSLL